MEPLIFFLEKRVRLKNSLIYNLCNLGVPFTVGDIKTHLFSDNEMMCEYNTSIRNKVVYIVSSPNTSEKIIMLNLAIDAAKRAGAKEIVPIITYYPYGRSDKKDQPRGAIGGKMIAEMLENRGATSVMLFDLHADQTQGFFNIPVIHMEGKYVFDSIIANLCGELDGNVVLCGPDAGASKRVKGFRDRVKSEYGFNIPMVMIDKTRVEANKIDEMVLIGDVTGKDVIIIDDMADTCGTLVKGCEHLLEKGAKSVRAMVTHGVLSGSALIKLDKSNLHEFYCTDSLPIMSSFINYELNKVKTKDVVTEVTITGQIAKAIKGISNGISIESLKTEKC